MPASGSCLCGDIVFEYTGEPATTILCHCVDCQKWTGAAYTANVVVPRANFKVSKGTCKDYDAVGASGKVNKHWFCPRCGSSIYSAPDMLPDVYCVKSGGLDGGAANHDIKVEIYNRDRLGYAKPVAGAEQKPEMI